MNNRTSADRRLLTGAAIAAWAFVLGGCLDVQYDVSLRNDGGGTLSTTIVYDKEMSDFAQKNGTKPQSESTLLLNGKPVLRTSKMQNGHLVEQQRVEFARLADLTTPDARIEVTDLGRTFFGMDTSRIHVGFGKAPNGANGKQDEESATAKQMMAEIMKGHFLTVKLHLPCAVSTASTLTMVGEKIAPTVDSGWLHGSTVTWEIPLRLVFTSSNKEAPQFEVVCRSWMGIPAGKTRS